MDRARDSEFVELSNYHASNARRIPLSGADASRVAFGHLCLFTLGWDGQLSSSSLRTPPYPPSPIIERVEWDFSSVSAD